MADLGRFGAAGRMCLRCQLQAFVATHARSRRGISSSSNAATVEAQGKAEMGQTVPQDEIPVAPLHSTPTFDRYRPPQRSVSGNRKASVAMFQSIVQKQAGTSTGPGDSIKGSTSIEIVKDVARLQAMLEKEGATLAEAYAFFTETVYPQMTKDLTGIPQIVRNQIGVVLLDPLAEEKARDFDSDQLPSVARITEIMIELDVLRPSQWATLVISLVQHIYGQKTVPEATGSLVEYENAMARRDSLVYDLLGAWRAFCAQSPSLDNPMPETAAPNLDQARPRPSYAGGKYPRQQQYQQQHQQQQQQKPSLETVFGAMFPQYMIPSLSRPTFAAFATFRLLTDTFNRSRAVRNDAAPFLQLMQGLLLKSDRIRQKDFRPIFDTFPDLPKFIWPQQDRAATAFLDPASGPAGDAPGLIDRDIHRQLGEAVKSMNLNMVKRAWLGFWGEAATPSDDRIRELTQQPNMFNYFILAYSMMRQPQLAIDVWNNMEQIGIAPTVKTWTAMLQGFAKAKNPRGIETIWEKLLASRTQLDTAVWTARISGLFMCNEPDAGIRALSQMADYWQARADPQYAPAAVQLSAEPVNAALAGLLRAKRKRDAPKLLAWAAAQGVNPDVYTFNTLLRPLVLRGDIAGIDEIFSIMRSIDLQADTATFTVLLDAALSRIGDLPPAQQIAIVERVFAAMTASNIDINMQVYARVVHLLLVEGDRAEEPVKAVLAHIWNRGLELTSHIYTMLAEHYFARDPPNTDAVAALIENRRLHRNKGVDRIFWERVICGYSEAGELPRALEIFDRAFASGTPMSLPTLHVLLAAVLAAGDGPTAERVVEAARKLGSVGGTDHQSGPSGDRIWKHRFWHLANQYGLLSPLLVRRFRAANDLGDERR
ncbi:uncharacterized protein C8A04DRAFT_38907 [Dichotomopilus funicola]|uniref:Pentatricopeptide repeat-containing protein n=1 Tax=Dichotomopilus funicola TaxID=1934379 RepID=A0AAN6V028_9PEZI|nr:hypothetical protein C8A04DRAFT_38907 [Dichotomopilus funicola]